MKYLTIAASIFGISTTIFMVIVSWMLAKGWHVIPDLERGFTWNVNLLELYIAIGILSLQVVSTGIFLIREWKYGNLNTKE